LTKVKMADCRCLEGPCGFLECTGDRHRRHTEFIALRADYDDDGEPDGLGEPTAAIAAAPDAGRVRINGGKDERPAIDALGAQVIPS
jgi:hypothetical protein